MTFDHWIKLGKDRGASDLQIESGVPPVYRVRGELFAEGDPVEAHSLKDSLRALLGTVLWQELQELRSCDFSRTIAGARCRFNVFHTVRGFAACVRILSTFQNSLRDCNLHPDLQRFTLPRSGLVLVSGATGSGKTTTLAALIEEINTSARKNIIVIESPIEHYFQNRKSFIRQREVPRHAPTFERALTDSMRENPDLLVIGEMRTPEVMRLTLNAAETGHLVFATLHSATSAEALSRIQMSFAPEIQASVRAQLADCLVGVICQRLQYLPQAKLRVPQLEILTANASVKSLVRQGLMSQIVSAIQTGADDGMWSFERYQRWIDQKKDWVMPRQARAAIASEPKQVVEPVGRPVRMSRSQSYGEGESAQVSHAHEIDGDDDLEALAKKILAE